MRSAMLIVAIAIGSAQAAAPPAPWKLTAEDRQFLDGLTFLIDPRGGERVSVPVLERGELWMVRIVDQPAWRFPGGERKPARLLDMAGESLLPRGGVKRLDFVAECRAVLREEPIRNVPSKLFVMTFDNPDLELAAWCRRLGHEELSAHFLSRIGNRPEAVKELREALAWRSFETAINAYRGHSDAEALARGERHVRLYPDVERYLAPCKTLIAELRRRQKAGGLRGRQPFPPAGFQGWPVARRVAFLVKSLEDADAFDSPPSIVNPKSSQSFGSDPRVRALIEVGDAAVPALLDAAEGDERLTRAVARHGYFARGLDFVPVRKAAAQAALAIIGSGTFLGGLGIDRDFPNVNRMRAYWKRYGAVPMHKRLMAHLTNPRADPRTWREAAAMLAHLGSEPAGRFTLDYEIEWWVRKRPNPALALDRPTVVEAILAAMGRELPAAADDPSGWTSREVRAPYLAALADLGDPRALPLLHARLKTAEGVERCQLADCCRRLGSSGPIDLYAKDIEGGRVALVDRGLGTVELWTALRALIEARRPACDRALFAVTRPSRPTRGVIRDHVFSNDFQGADDLLIHPFLVPLLAAELGDATPTGVRFAVDEFGIEKEWPSGGSDSELLPPELADPAKRREEVMEGHGDRVALLLSDLIAGSPFYHPLLRNRGVAQVALRGLLARYQGRFRLTTEPEADALGVRGAILPDLRPLGRAATAADVKAGRAVFHLPAGKPLTMKLPAVAELAKEKGIIVQAEEGPDGKAVYGVILRHAIRRVEADEVKRVVPLAD